MRTPRQATLELVTAAQALAAANWQQNLLALGATQPELAASLGPVDTRWQWIFSRDGALTALDDAGRWWGGCSVPHRAAQELLQSLQINGAMACFLAPAHAAQIAFAMRRLSAQQAVVAILPGAEDLAVALHGHDFSDDIAAHRLWFVATEQWAAQLAELLAGNPGLVIPQQFIRTAILSEEISGTLIETAQRIFTAELSRRAAMIAQLRSTRPLTPARQQKRITVAAPMHFRLWNDAGGALAQTIAEDSTYQWNIINLDDPISASPLMLAAAAAESDALIAANLTRADCGQILHEHRPLVTWLTIPRIPPISTAGHRGFLLLADRRWLDLARKAGWPDARLAVATWPHIASSTDFSSISIIADTRPLEPSIPFELSSHQLLWDLIQKELLANPAILTDVCAYLHSRMERLSIRGDGLDQHRLIEELILPAYQQGLATHLIAANLPLRIFGQGWPDIPTFAAHAAGPIQNAQALQAAISGSAALIHAWPASHAHPVDTCGPPVIRLGHRGILGLIEDAQKALACTLKPPPPRADALNMATLIRTLEAVLAIQ